MRFSPTLIVLAVVLTAGSAAAQTGAVVPADHQQLFIPAVSAPLSAPLSFETTAQLSFDRAKLAPSTDRSRPRIMLPLYFSLAMLQGADLFSTRAAQANGASELNPLLNTVGGGTMGQTAVKAALTTSSIFLAERLWRKNKRVAAIVSMIAANSLLAVVVRHNMQNAGR